MQAKTIKNKLWAKLLAAVLTLALIFTMMPLAVGTVYADEATAEQTDVVAEEADAAVEASEAEETNESVEVITNESGSDADIENNIAEEDVVSALEGETAESAKVLVKGNVLKQEKEITEADLSSILCKEDVVFDGINKKARQGAITVKSGVYFTDLIEYMGLKEGAKIDHFVITTNKIDEGSSAQQETEMSYQWLMTEPNDKYNNKKAMLAFEWDDKGTVTTGTRVFVGAFDDMATASNGEIANKPNWIDTLVSIEVVGTVPEPKSNPAPAAAVKDGQKIVVDGNTYTVLSASAGTVAFTKAKNVSKAVVPVNVKVNGKAYKVTQVNAKAFIGSKIKSAVLNKNVTKIKKNAFKNSKVVQLIVKTKKLKKKSVKGSLKGSKVKKVVVKVGSKKSNKKYLKKYKKYFTKKNAGKKVKVVRAY